jgi:hypothetical protein
VKYKRKWHKEEEIKKTQAEKCYEIKGRERENKIIFV